MNRPGGLGRGGDGAGKRAECIGQQVDVRGNARRKIGLHRFDRARQERTAQRAQRNGAQATHARMTGQHDERTKWQVGEHVGDQVEGRDVVRCRRGQIGPGVDAEIAPA